MSLLLARVDVIPPKISGVGGEGVKRRHKKDVEELNRRLRQEDEIILSVIQSAMQILN